MARYQKEVIIFVAPLLLLSFAAYTVLLSLAGWALNEMLDNKLHGGNAASLYLIVFSLIAGVVGVASVILGFLALSGKPETKAVAVASSVVAWLLSLLALGLAAKQIHIGKLHNKRLKALEAFAIIVAGTQLLYILAVHVGLVFKRTFVESTTAPAAQADEKPIASETV